MADLITVMAIKVILGERGRRADDEYVCFLIVINCYMKKNEKKSRSREFFREKIEVNVAGIKSRECMHFSFENHNLITL